MLWSMLRVAVCCGLGDREWATGRDYAPEISGVDPILRTVFCRSEVGIRVHDSDCFGLRGGGAHYLHRPLSQRQTAAPASSSRIQSSGTL